MNPQQAIFVPRVPHPLPPLILHPISNARGPQRLLQSVKSSLILNGLLPRDDSPEEELLARLVAGRYCELRMLFYIGRDLCRWVEQCMEIVARDSELSDAGLSRLSFMHLLVFNPPQPVWEKLQGWGVTDFSAIFRRAFAMQEVFHELPPEHLLGHPFILNHHRYADAIFEAILSTDYFQILRPQDFPFELYSSGEYARLLEEQWNGS